jgi:hypothetical protein
MLVNLYSARHCNDIEENYPDLYWNVLLKYSSDVIVREIYEDVVFTIKDEDFYSFLSALYKNIAYRPLIIDNIINGNLSIQIYDDNVE